jgi:nitrite reductase/ring-hydroxylating ferredoxin subunit
VTDEEWRELQAVDRSAGIPIRARFGDEPILIFETAAGLRGVQAVCPHADHPLATAQLLGGGQMLRCSFHSYTFRFKDGRGVNCPGYKVAVFDVKAEGGALFARRPPQ